jgi:hypothetical protein
MNLTITSTKKTDRKPYAARLLPGNQREFAKGRKATNTTTSFDFDDLAVGSVIEWRASVWTGDGFTSETCVWAIVTKTDFVRVCRELAMKAVDWAAAGNPVTEFVASEFGGDLSGGLTAEEEIRLRAEAGGDFIAMRRADGSVALPGEFFGDDENDDGTVLGQAWRLPTVTFCDCKAAAKVEVE